MSHEITAAIGGILMAIVVLLTGCSFSVNENTKDPRNTTKTWNLDLFPSDGGGSSK